MNKVAVIVAGKHMLWAVDADVVKNVALELVWNKTYQAYMCNQATYEAIYKALNEQLMKTIEIAAQYVNISVILSALNTANKISPRAIDLKLNLLNATLDDYYQNEVKASFC